MPKFTKSQVILLAIQAVACLLTFAVMLGLWISDIETILPMIFLGLIVVLAATFFLGGQPESTATVVRPVAQSVRRTTPQPRYVQPQASVRPRNGVQQANPNRKKFGEDLWNWIVRQFEKIATYLKPKASNAVNVAGNRANLAGTAVANNVKQYPVLWMAIVMSLLACYQFVQAYETDNWKQGHWGMVSTVFAIFGFLSHFNLLGKTSDVLREEWKIVWLVGSMGSIFLWFVHDWSAMFLIASIVSFTCAVITVGDWWGATRSGAGDLAGIGFEKFLNFFKGDHGMWKGLLVACLSTLVVINFFFFGGELLLDDEQAWARASSMVYVILMLAFLAVIIWAIHKRIKTK